MVRELTNEASELQIGMKGKDPFSAVAMMGYIAEINIGGF